MKKIAFVSSYEFSPWAGCEDLWSQAAMVMARRGHKVGVNVKRWKNEPAPITELRRLSTSFSYRRFPYRFIFSVLGDKLPAGMSSLSAGYLSLFYNWLDKFKPDLVLFSQGNPYEGLDWTAACSLRKIPYALIVQSGWEGWWPTDRWADEALKAYQNAKKCFFLCQNNLDVFTRQVGMELTNVEFVNNSFRVRYEADIPWPDNKGIYNWACVGGLTPFSKGQDILFKVLCDEKWRKRPIKTTLFYGGGGERSLGRLKDTWKLDNVNFGGFVDDVESIWRDNQMLVMSSRFEGMPMALTEAMLCGRPAVVTDVGACSEIIEDNISGFIAKAPKAEFLDEAMERAWQRRSEWREIGRAAAKRVKEVVPRDPASVFADKLEKCL